MNARSFKTEEHFVTEEPYYLPSGDEIRLFEAAYGSQIPVLLKGPTGCGKTRFIHHMAWRLKRPLVTISCHDDLTTSDLVGRYLIQGGETVWVDGPLTAAVKAGGICYLDEIVEARKDTTVVIHPLADDRRILPIEKLGMLIVAPPEFMLAISYNPGYQSVIKDLKQSTRQRFLAIEFAYQTPEREAEVVSHESGVDADAASRLVGFGRKTRNLKDRGLVEGASTRLMIHAGRLMRSGIPAREALRAAVISPLSDDQEMLEALEQLASSFF